MSPRVQPSPHKAIMTSPAAIRFIKSTTKQGLGSVYLQCHVKPGASKQREGILEVSDVIELCVAAQPREGESNKAVLKLISNVDYSNCRGLYTTANASIGIKGPEDRCRNCQGYKVSHQNGGSPGSRSEGRRIKLHC